ncbi:MAG: hypothetical protein K8I00_02740, partial [Candidatus Omnitrophica bacterium]|nr:hypothetical protein [Candidatus Omnitrophota bacterium]
MSPESEAEILTLLKDVQKRLTYLEKKIDTLVKQPSDRAASPRSYSPMSRSYAGAGRPYEKRESSFGMKKARPGKPAGKKRSDVGRVFPKKNQE